MLCELIESAESAFSPLKCLARGCYGDVFVFLIDCCLPSTQDCTGTLVTLSACPPGG